MAARCLYPSWIPQRGKSIPLGGRARNLRSSEGCGRAQVLARGHGDNRDNLMMGAKPIRVAIAGCGAVADFHLRALRTIPTAQCVALFDSDVLRAEMFRARHRLDAEIVTNLEQIPGLADYAIV